MILVEKHDYKINSKHYKELDNVCLASKNLYNCTLYHIRQHYFETGEFLGFCRINKMSKAIGTEVSQDTFESVSATNNKSKTKKLNEIRYGEWKHSLPTNPTKYDRLLNYVETVEHVCDLAREEADEVLMHLEEAEEFFSDERNYRYYDFEKKMNEVAKIIEQLEQVRKRIRKLSK